MKKNIKTIEVTSVLFESNDPEVLLKGLVSQGHMTFETDMIISQSQLNIVFNLLQKQNKSLVIDQFLKSEKMYNDETLYTATFSEEMNKSIDLYNLTRHLPPRQIRA